MTSGVRSAPVSVQTGVADLVQTLAAVPVREDDRRCARLRLADTAFATLVGGGSRQGRRGAQLATDLYGEESVASRAFRLVAACRITEIDDVDLLSCITPGSIVVTTVLAIAGTGGSLGPGTDPGVGPDLGLDDVLDVVVRGYEVALGLGEAIRGPHRLAGGVWPSLAVGGVTAAAVTSWLLGAGEDEVAAALVLAAQQSIAGNPRGNARESVLAGAVLTGIGCALAARRGFAATGSRGGVLGDLLDTPPGGDAQARIHRPSIKPFCSARQAMTAVSAVRAILAAQQLSASEIDLIDVDVPSEYAAMLDKPSVGTRRESLSSAQYQIALAAVEPAGLYDVERRTLLTRGEFHALMSLVRVHSASDLSARYPTRWPARVRISARGRTFEAAADEVPGERDVSVEHLTAKLSAFTTATAGPPATDLVDRAAAAADLADLRELTTFVTGKPGRHSANPEIRKEPLA